MMLVIATQYMENYGTETDPYWKFKGGSDYKILNVPSGIDYQEVVDAANLNKETPFTKEYVVEWSIESDSYLSCFEKSQMDFDGEIIFPEPRIEYSKLMETV